MDLSIDRIGCCEVQFDGRVQNAIPERLLQDNITQWVGKKVMLTVRYDNNEII